MAVQSLMDVSRFLELAGNPGELNKETLVELDHLIHEYPYFQTAQMIYTVNLYKETHPQFNIQVKKAAAYALDRRKLKEWIESVRIHELRVQPEPPAEPVHEVREDNLDKQAADSVVSEQEIDSVSEQAKPIHQLLTKEELIERFIREEPRITTQRASFFNPSTTAMRSATDDEEIVTETLAILFFKQGNPSKAIKIYEKLSLLFPEKSSYFAAQIKKISSKE